MESALDVEQTAGESPATVGGNKEEVMERTEKIKNLIDFIGHEPDEILPPDEEELYDGPVVVYRSNNIRSEEVFFSTDLGRVMEGIIMWQDDCMGRTVYRQFSESTKEAALRVRFAKIKGIDFTEVNLEQVFYFD